jgi:DNA replication protein DnaC
VNGDELGYCDPCTAERERAHEIEERRKQAEEFAARRLELSGIPKSYRVGFGTVDEKESAVIAAARDWAAGDLPGLALVGSVGVGKTYLAGAAATARTRRGPVRWLSTARLLHGLRHGFGTEQHEKAVKSIEPFGSLALVLDDLDKVRPTEFAIEPLFLALDQWVTEGLPLLVTLNRHPDRLANDWPGAFAQPIASRLTGYCKLVYVKGRDRRRVVA